MCIGFDPHHCEIELLHLLEDLHMILFLVVILYFSYSLWLLRSIQKTSQEWKELELVARKTSGQNQLFSRHLKRKEDYDRVAKKHSLTPCGCARRWRVARKMREAADDFQYVCSSSLLFTVD